MLVLFASLLALLPLALAAPDPASTAGSATGCYYGDGTVATDWSYGPCRHANTTYNICCQPLANELCLANGLCLYPGHYMYRGPCDNAKGDGCRSICPEGELPPFHGLSSLDLSPGCYCHVLRGL